MCLGLCYEASLKITEGPGSFDPRDLMRNELRCLSPADRTFQRFVSNELDVMTVGTLPHVD
jgi:hypothetical protein